MGNKGSATAKTAGAAEDDPPVAGSGWRSEEYVVQQAYGPAATGMLLDRDGSRMVRKLRMRVDAEALVFLYADRSPLTAFPYYSIMCWGHNDTSFQFRAFDNSLPPHTASVHGPEPSADTAAAAAAAAAAGAPAAAAAAAPAAVEGGEDAKAPSSAPGSPDGPAARTPAAPARRGDSGSQLSEPDDAAMVSHGADVPVEGEPISASPGRTPPFGPSSARDSAIPAPRSRSTSPASRADAVAAADGDAAPAAEGDAGAPGAGSAVGDSLFQRPGVTFCLVTSEGALVEQRLLAAVRMLMSDMSRRGVDDAELLQVTSAIDHDPDRAIAGLRQLAITRRFDAKQAFGIVSQIGRVSPFDQVEAAVLLYPALMNTESFHVVLAAFEDDDDKDNVCHRLGLDLAQVMRGAVGAGKHKARQA
ncbi:hypothetical protein FNF31_04237 [Cafeteria roenbergensis]|uniref:DUF4476 domain-containing protein n=1 Tax=Cafeteria roenbergensis TaxID=33653 RepID=A0A5A8D5W4_CAFRO|nr:hypothetical protein FNF31_04237 [Cafeteria roenbergensis]